MLVLTSVQHHMCRPAGVHTFNLAHIKAQAEYNNLIVRFRDVCDTRIQAPGADLSHHQAYRNRYGVE